jgi:hypothetical protein
MNTKIDAWFIKYQTALLKWQNELSTMANKKIKFYVVFMCIKDYFIGTCTGDDRAYNLVFMDEMEDFSIMKNCVNEIVRINRQQIKIGE